MKNPQYELPSHSPINMAKAIVTQKTTSIKTTNNIREDIKVEKKLDTLFILLSLNNLTLVSPYSFNFSNRPSRLVVLFSIFIYLSSGYCYEIKPKERIKCNYTLTELGFLISFFIAFAFSFA